MADKKISALTAATTPLAGTEVLPIVQSGSTVKVSVSNLTAGRQVLASAVGVNVSPATQLHAQGSNANLGTLELDSDASVDYVGLTMWTKKTSPNANSRNWQVAANYQGYGTFDILNSTTTTGNPTTARLSMDNAGNTTLSTGNLIQGTAAKGINFTANTPAAGMTSQLLNWYEEGNWTPAQGAGLTVVGAFSSTGHYTRIGRLVYVQGVVSGATSVAVNSANIITNNLPYSANTAASGSMFDAALTTNGGVAASTTIVYATTTIAATASITFSVVYIV